ncbi:MAG: tRNA 2-thiouridine synthesizing protein D [Halieaceae bacterium]|jgi:tRNA 2-thiouridine synthesizing protein D
MRYTLLILSPPDAGASARHAVEFAGALIDAGHEILCVFFYDAGVLTAAKSASPAQDESDLRARWQSLAQSAEVPLFVCVASAARFGISEDETTRLPAFAVGGLGELIEAGTRSDRLMTFAG